LKGEQPSVMVRIITVNLCRRKTKNGDNLTSPQCPSFLQRLFFQQSLSAIQLHTMPFFNNNRSLFSILALGIPALGLSAFTVQDDRATQIMNESKSAFAKIQGFTAKFKYSIKPATKNAREMTKEGEIKFKKKNSANGRSKYVLKTTEQEMYCNGQKVWVYLRGDNEVSEMDYADAAGEGMDVEAIFKLYESSSSARYEASEAVSGVACDKIFLAIKDAKLDYNQAYIWISTKDHLPRKAVLIDRQQTRTTLELLGLDTKAVPADGTFTFNKANYPGVKQY